MSLLLPMLIEKENNTRVRTLCEQVLQLAIDSVDATPIIALRPLFDSVIVASSEGYNGSLQTTIDTLFSILNEVDTSSNWVYMLHEICKLIFCPKLLRIEYKSYCKDSNDEGKKNKDMPVRCAFEKLLLMGNTTKPHVCKTAVSIISSAWLGEHESNDVGVLAIPYRRNIVDLLMYKVSHLYLQHAEASHNLSYNLDLVLYRRVKLTIVHCIGLHTKIVWMECCPKTPMNFRLHELLF